MAGSIVFKSGASWDVSSLLFRYALGSLKDLSGVSGEAEEQLHLAAEFGFLTLEEVAEPDRSLLFDAIDTEEFRSLVATTASEAEGYELADTERSIVDLQASARRERLYPKWLSCTPNGVIVDGLSADRIADATQLNVWPVVRTDSSDGSPLRFMFALDQLEVEVDLSELAEGDIDFGDAKLTIHSQGEIDCETLASLSDCLLDARSSFGLA